MDYTQTYCLHLLQTEYKQNAAIYKVCLDKYGKKAKVTQTVLFNVKSGVNKYLTLKKMFVDYLIFSGILLRIKNARIGMNEKAVIEQLKKIDGLFKEENFN
jgi:hypothetical protein